MLDVVCSTEVILLTAINDSNNRRTMRSLKELLMIVSTILASWMMKQCVDILI